jgi:hypothetical protein
MAVAFAITITGCNSSITVTSGENSSMMDSTAMMDNSSMMSQGGVEVGEAMMVLSKNIVENAVG